MSDCIHCDKGVHRSSDGWHKHLYSDGYILCPLLKRDRPAPQASSLVSVLHICTAYESGFGHGLHDRKPLPNPYQLGTGESQAYQLGFDAGCARRAQRSAVETPREHRCSFVPYDASPGNELCPGCQAVRPAVKTGAES